MLRTVAWKAEAAAVGSMSWRIVKRSGWRAGMPSDQLPKNDGFAESGMTEPPSTHIKYRYCIRGGQYRRITEPLPGGVAAAAVPGEGARCAARYTHDLMEYTHDITHT